jgi:Zn-dependent M28 family amino/carboxypeptidase
MARAARPPVSLFLAVLLVVAGCQTDEPAPSGTTPGGSGNPEPSAGASGSADLAASDALRDAVGSEAILEHLDALFAAAQAGDGTRASGLEGYTGSQEYVVDQLTEAGYEITIDEFTFPYFTETAEPRVTVVGGPTFAGSDHLRALIFSRSGELEAPIVAVAVDDDGEPIGSGGCARADWQDFPSGSIAVAGPGPCFRRQMVEQAQDAEAAALIVTSAEYEVGAVRRPTLLEPDGIEIPALYASNVAGEALLAAAAAGGSVQLSVETLIQDRLTANVFAERAGAGEGATGREVVMVGGHLDSVIDGPGINDNGSGTMTIVEIARQLAELPPTERTVRFAFWAAEELGLYGSYHWVIAQDRDEIGRIVAYVNLDMIGSSNYTREVYASSSGAFESRDITDAFGAYFDAVGLTWQAEDLGGASDHAPFEDFGIPTGGLFSGASERKTVEQADLFGGVAGEPMDPCYHLSCDTPLQVNPTALDELGDAAAHVLMLLLSGDLLPTLDEDG